MTTQQAQGEGLASGALGEVEKHFASIAPGEAYLVAQFLPRCANCGGTHPRGRTPPLEIVFCPDCGRPVEPGRAQLVPAKLTMRNAWGRLAAALLGLGRFFHRLGERFKR